MIRTYISVKLWGDLWSFDRVVPVWEVVVRWDDIKLHGQRVGAKRWLVDLDLYSIGDV